MRALIAIAGGFAFGILEESTLGLGWPAGVFAILIALVFSVAYFSTLRRVYLLGILTFLFTAFGMWRMLFAETPLPNSFTNDLRHRTGYEGVVTHDPDLRDAHERVEVRVTKSGETTTLLVVAPRSTTIAVGDTVRVYGTLQVPQPFNEEGGRVFRYDKYLERDGVRFMLEYASLSVEKRAPWYSIPATLARGKHAFIDGLDAALPEPYASLASGIVIGGKSGLGNDLTDAFTRSGLVQIIVLSGYNIMVVAEWVMAALALTKLSRRSSALAGAFAVLVFVGVAGFSASALRAMLMAFIALYARATGRSYAAGRALLVTITAMLAVNPLYLVYDPGFGLSMVATAGLIWLAPIIEMWLSARRAWFLKITMPHAVVSSEKIESSQKPFSPSGFWLNTIATTLAAQIAVLPLLLYFTGNLSLVAIPANILAAPLVPVTMALSVIAGFAGILFTFVPIIGILLSFPAYLANDALIFIATKAANVPFAAFTLPAFPFWLVLLAYAALIAVSKRFSTIAQLRFLKKAST